MIEQGGPVLREMQNPEVLNQHFEYLVVDPYSVNIKTPELDANGNRPSQFGEARLSAYSAFVINTAYNMWLNGDIENIVLFSDASFGDQRASTADLMREFLMRERKDGRPSVPEAKIIVLDDPDLNQTATQLRKLKELGIGKDKVALYLGMEYHIDRIGYHATPVLGYGVKTKMISAEEMWKQLHPEFDLEKFREVMPLDQAKKKERIRKLEAFVDRRGLLPIAMKKAGQGAIVDIEKVGERIPGQPRQLRHIIVTGTTKLEELGLS